MLEFSKRELSIAEGQVVFWGPGEPEDREEARE